MLIISINLLGQNYQHLTTSAYVLLCLCVSEYQPLVITAANHLHITCTSLLEMCRHCPAATVKNRTRHSTAKLRDHCCMERHTYVMIFIFIIYRGFSLYAVVTSLYAVTYSLYSVPSPLYVVHGVL